MDEGVSDLEGISVVIPTIGRPSLRVLLDRLRAQDPGIPYEILVVPDDERHGPAATRNRGWRAARYPWVAFLDDDVQPPPGWFAALVRDLRQPPEVGGVQGRLVVTGAAGTDWAANTAGLSDAWWATADMAYRREALEQAGGFDERFPRAYREDADLAHRVTRLGYRLVRGARHSAHPVRPESVWVSLRTQRGNADDALLRRLWGPRWHDRLAAPRGRRRRHAGTTALALATLGLTAARRPGPAVLAALGWAALSAEFVAARRRAAPRDPWLPLVVTSVAIPPLAVGHWLAGWYRHRGARPWPVPGVSAGPPGPVPRPAPTPSPSSPCPPASRAARPA